MIPATRKPEAPNNYSSNGQSITNTEDGQINSNNGACTETDTSYNADGSQEGTFTETFSSPAPATGDIEGPDVYAETYSFSSDSPGLVAVDDAAVTLSDNAQANLVGGDNQIGLGTGAIVSISEGDGNAIAGNDASVDIGTGVTNAFINGSSDTISATGDDDSFLVSGTNVSTIDLTDSDSDTITASNETFNIGTDVTNAVIDGSEDGVATSGNGDIFTLQGTPSSVSISNSSGDVINASDDDVALNENVVNADFNGSGNVVVVEDSGDDLIINGSTIVAVPDIGTGATTLQGSDDTVYVDYMPDGGSYELPAKINTETLNLWDSSDDNINSNDNVINLGSGVGNVYINGEGNSIVSTGSAHGTTMTLTSGSGDTVSAVDQTIIIEGNNQDITISGSGDNILAEGTGDVVTAAGADVTFAQKTQGTIVGNSNFIFDDGGDIVYIQGSENSAFGNSSDYTYVFSGTDNTGGASNFILDSGETTPPLTITQIPCEGGDGLAWFVPGDTASDNVVVQEEMALGHVHGADTAEGAFSEINALAALVPTEGTGVALSEGAAWDQPVITWSLAPQNAGDLVTGSLNASEGAAAQQAFDTWQDVLPGISFQEVAYSSESDITLGFGNFQTSTTGVLGYTTYMFNANDAMTQSVITLENPNEDALISQSDGQEIYSGTDATFDQLLLHEIGHALGFADNTDQDSIMYYVLNENNTGFDATDLNGAAALYGTQGMAANQVIQAMAALDSGTASASSYAGSSVVQENNTTLALAVTA